MYAHAGTLQEVSFNCQLSQILMVKHVNRSYVIDCMCYVLHLLAINRLRHKSTLRWCVVSSVSHQIGKLCTYKP